ncbi:MAG: methylenetetrahydrofolate reductase C-terminal domain-containing protein [Anaerolineales bacterium]
MAFRGLQRYPHILEWIYRTTYRILKPFQRWLSPDSRVERLLIRLEKISKGAIFDCRMCGQCVLHSTGMTCPMTCPKNLRNGPCGGVLLDGSCEILPDKPCIWVQAWEHSQQMPLYGNEIIHIQAPLNHSLQGTSSWVNDLHLKEKMAPRGWDL